MPITVVCSNCGTRFDVPDSYVGRTGNCTSCGAPMVVPAPGGGAGVKLQRPAGSGEQAAAPSRPAGSGEHPAAPSRPVSSGEHPAAGQAATVGRKLGDYELVRKLGNEKSSVFLGKNAQGAAVAIKVLPEAIARKSPTTGKRFLREARSLFGKVHPNLVKSQDAGEELGTYFLVMEFFQGQTLGDLIDQKGGRVSEREAVALAIEIAKGIGFLQDQGLVHRNIKPEHVMVGPEGGVKLVGMGLVRQTEDEGAAQVTGAGMIVGTPEYMSPEQAMSQSVDSRSDLYSLGIAIYRMLVGQTPFHDKIPSRVVAQLVKQPAPSLQKGNAEASNAITAVVERLLQKEPADRYGTASELVQDLEAIQAGRLVAGLPPGFTERANKKSGSGGGGGGGGGDTKKLVVIVGVLVVVVVILLVVVLVMAMGGN